MFVVSANETEVAFFKKEDYGLYKANPKSAWWPQCFTLQQRSFVTDGSKVTHGTRTVPPCLYRGLFLAYYYSSLCLFYFHSLFSLLLVVTADVHLQCCFKNMLNKLTLKSVCDRVFKGFYKVIFTALNCECDEENMVKCKKQSDRFISCFIL